MGKNEQREMLQSAVQEHATGCAYPTMGIFCRPQLKEEQRNSIEQQMDPSWVWVRYFDIQPPESSGGGWLACVSVEAVPRERLLRVDREAVVKRPEYLVALASLESARAQ